MSIGELLAIYDPDSQSWKMSERLLIGDLMRYSEALPKSGIMRNGRIYEQSDMGAPHKRERIWIIAYPDNSGNRASGNRTNRKPGAGNPKQEVESELEHCGAR